MLRTLAAMLLIILLVFVLCRWGNERVAYKLLSASQGLFEPEDKGVRETGKRRNVRKTTRAHITPYQKKLIAYRQQYKCGCGCGGILKPDYHLDHKTPLWAGGSNSEDNLVALNSQCHNLKTSLENSVWLSWAESDTKHTAEGMYRNSICFFQ